MWVRTKIISYLVGCKVNTDVTFVDIMVNIVFYCRCDLIVL